MNEKLTTKLHKEFPELYKYKLSFEHNDGWYDIIYNLSKKIYDICKEKGYEIPIAMQVKEKFGTLRFYIDSGYGEIYDAIDKAEKLSEITCEVCGEPGITRDNHGWYTTLCDKHQKDRFVRLEKIWFVE